jgi:hypothetical protein
VSGRDFGGQRDFGSRGYVDHDHSGHAGDR